MSNPLARVVMSNVAQKSGKVERRSSNSTNRAVRGKGKPNLGRQGKEILSSLLDGNTKVNDNSNKSYDKSTYGRGSNVGSNTSQTIKTLDSLVPGGSRKAETNIRTNDRKKDCVVDKSRPNLKSLCTLDNISVGKAGIEKKSTNSRPENRSLDNRTSDNRRDRDMINKLNLDDLARGKSTSTSSSEKRSIKPSTNKSSSGMTTLGELAGDKTKNSQKKNKEPNKTVKSKSSYVKSSVINNLEAHIPKVSLQSIGKGSLL